MIPSNPGNEIILGGVCGVYCLYGGDNVPPEERVIWHAGIEFFPLFNGWPDAVMSTALGDLDDDGLLDVAVITESLGINGAIHALKGQYAYKFWKYGDCGGYGHFNGIACIDLTKDNIPEVVATTACYTCALLSGYPIDNNAPDTPSITGPTKGKPGVEYTYQLKTIDPDNDDIFYLIDWGDETGVEVAGTYTSGDEISVNHIWAEKGTYTIKVKARDIHGAESDWGTLTVTMPKNQQSSQQSHQSSQQSTIPLFFQILQRLMNSR